MRHARTIGLGIGLLLVGCAHQPPPDLAINPSIRYEGPRIESAGVDGQHALSVVVPTGGWEVHGDKVLRYFMDNRIFLTVVRPDPDQMQTQALTRFDITPGVRIDEPLAVYVRVVDHDADPNESRFAFATAIAPQRP